MMDLLRLATLLLICACSQIKTNTGKSLQQWQKSIELEGEGRTRLEVGEKHYLASFESAWSENPLSWALALEIPLQGERLLSFTDLSQQQAQQRVDFRLEVEQAFKYESQRQKWQGEGIVGEFFAALHQMLRQLRAEQSGAQVSCTDGKDHWTCFSDGHNWKWWWDERKEFLGAQRILKNGWLIRIEFKNLQETKFKRVTLHLIRVTEEESERSELRQELFFH